MAAVLGEVQFAGSLPPYKIVGQPWWCTGWEGSGVAASALIRATPRPGFGECRAPWR